MKKRIVIELYDHTKNDEVLEILDRLAELGFSESPIFEREENGKMRRIDRVELQAFPNHN